jgi:hypothetical protein
MTTDIFEFWDLPWVSKGGHPADRRVLERVQHNFDLECLPGCFAGPLKTAPVVLLYLSPGLSEFDHQYARSKKVRELHRRTRQGYEPLWSREDHPPAYKWWRSHTKIFGKWDDVRDKIAFLNIGCYHSKHFKDHPLLAALPSSRVVLDWAQDVLFRQAIAGKRIVICMRSARYWGLQISDKPYGRALFAPTVNAGGHMKRDKLQKQITIMVQDAIKG